MTEKQSIIVAVAACLLWCAVDVFLKVTGGAITYSMVGVSWVWVTSMAWLPLLTWGLVVLWRRSCCQAPALRVGKGDQ